MLQFHYLECHTINEPVNIGKKLLETELAYEELLIQLFPSKGAYFKTRTKTTLVVNTFPTRPFGPSKGAVKTLFSGYDVQNLLRTVQEKLKLEKVIVVEDSKQPESEFILYKKRYTKDLIAFVNLDLFEFYKLALAVTENIVLPTVLVTLYGPGGSITAYHVPRGTVLKEISPNHADEASEYSFYNPLTGCEYGPDYELERDMGLVQKELSPGKHYRVKAADSFVFTFPYFNRSLQLTLCDDKEQTAPGGDNCNNCLACVSHCPAGILPNYIYHNSIRNDLEELENLNVALCLDCGHCTALCPAELNICREIEKYKKRALAQ